MYIQTKSLTSLLSAEYPKIDVVIVLLAFFFVFNREKKNIKLIVKCDMKCHVRSTNFQSVS